MDFVAAQIAARVTSLGFSRQGRTFHRIVGTGTGECIQLMDVQGRGANGGKGTFTVNFCARFPAMVGFVARLSGLDWLATQARSRELALGPGAFNGRLDDAVPEARGPRWPAELRHGVDFWMTIDESSDLAALAEGVALAIADHAPAWFDARNGLAAFGRPELARFGSPGVRDAVFAALLDGRLDVAAQRLRDAEPHRLATDEEQLAALLQLLREQGVDTDGVTWVKRPPDTKRQQRSAEVDVLRQQHASRVTAFQQQGDDWCGREDALLDAWIDATAARQHELDGRKLPLWQTIASAPLDARRTLLRRAIERIAEPGVVVRSTVANVWATYHDYNLQVWSRVAGLLLAADDTRCDESHAAALLVALAASAHRVREELTFDSLVAPVADTVRWIAKRADAQTRYAVLQSMTALLDTIRTATIDRCRKRHANPPPPDLLGAELAEKLATAYTPEAVAQMVALYDRFPERSYSGADRDAIVLLKRWLRADAEGRVPLAIENDDWGRELASALDELPAAPRQAMQGLLEWFDAGVDTKPGKAWSAELTRRACEFDREVLVDWLSGALSRFTRTTLSHVAGTPGIGAFPGETSGHALLGMVHLAGTLDAPELVPALEIVAVAAYVVVPDQRLRALGIGNVCVALLVQSTEGRERLVRLRKTIRQKMVGKTIDKALAAVK